MTDQPPEKAPETPEKPPPKTPETHEKPPHKPIPGRPTSYVSKIHDKIAKKMAEEGKINIEIAESLGISLFCYNDWRKKHPTFKDAVQQGKDAVDARVERALLKRAEGYEYREKTKGRSDKQGEFAKVTIKEVAPDVGAQKLWLTNRKPGEWRDKKEISGDPDRPFTLVVHKEEEDI